MIRFLLLVLLCLCAACSPVQRIANSSNAIRIEAQALRQHGEAIHDNEIVTRATTIDALAAGIHVELAGVEDKTPVWISMVIWGSVSVLAVAISVLLWQTGLGTLIRVAIGWVPRRKVSQAELAVDMLDPNRPEGDREFIAAMRSDPEFDLAFRKAQARRKA